MAHRKSLIQVKFRLRQDILRSLEREAKRHDRSTNDEIARRLERSLEQDQTERNRAGVEELLQAQMASMPKALDWLSREAQQKEGQIGAC
jgi:hypothetical protein